MYMPLCVLLHFHFHRCAMYVDNHSSFPDLTAIMSGNRLKMWGV